MSGGHAPACCQDPAKCSPLQRRPSFQKNDPTLAISHFKGKAASCGCAIRPGDYKMLKVLSQGDAGIVYRAKCGNELCAAKVVKAARGGGKEQGTFDMVAELRALGCLPRHPNVVGFIGAAVEHPNEIMLCEELCTGPSLQHFLMKHLNKRLPRHTAYGWIQQLFSGLAFLHGQDPIIIHRDLKPSNIVLSQDLATLKIIDFGTAKLVRRQEKGTEWHSGYNSGNARYMAPEVRRAEVGRYDESSDIFGAGLIAWRVGAMRDFITRERWPSEEWRPDPAAVGWPNLQALIAMCWSHDPRGRPSAAAALQMLHSFDDKPDLAATGVAPDASKFGSGGGGGCTVM